MSATNEFSILVVDDDTRAADMMARSLKHGGFEARAAYGGAQALELMAPSAPDVMIIDLAMPGMSGEEVAREARRRAAGVTLIALSGVRGDARNIGATEFDFYLRKPVSAEVVLDLVASVRVRGRDAG